MTTIKTEKVMTVNQSSTVTLTFKPFFENLIHIWLFSLVHIDIVYSILIIISTVASVTISVFLVNTLVPGTETVKATSCICYMAGNVLYYHRYLPYSDLNFCHSGTPTRKILLSYSVTLAKH